MLPPNEQLEFSLWFKTLAFRRKLNQANYAIQEAMRTYGPKYVAVSGGKDSLVVLDLLHKAGYGRELDYWWGDDGWDYPETLTFLDRLEEIYQIEISRFRNDWATADFAKKFGPIGRFNQQVHDAAGQSAHINLPEKYNLIFLGLRKDESSARYLNLKKRGLLYYAANRKEWHSCPLAKWTSRDIWAYIVGNGLEYNPVYDKLAELGVELKYRRVGPLTVHMVWQYGMLSTLKRGWPDLFNEFARRVPEARQFV
jgi:3'-phosphoadenosine 5'-phosphosulfate sulfotransferase (PAPS reductase)/FAD synthetase